MESNRVVRLFALISLVCGSTFAFAQQKKLLEKPLEQLISGPHIRKLGPKVTSESLYLGLYLPHRNQAQLDQFLTAVSDPASPTYRHYLSVDQFTKLYGPTQTDYDALITWAQEEGLEVTEKPINRAFVGVKGSIDVINRAFHVHVSNYVDDSTGRTFFAPDAEPNPDTPVVLSSITGLDNAMPARPLSRRKPSLSETSMQERGVPSFQTGSGPNQTFTPGDMRAAYYGSGSLTGSGQSVAIVSLDGYVEQDLVNYLPIVGINFSYIPVTNILVDGYSGVCTGQQGSGPCDDGEQLIDIANALGMAPGSSILFYEGANGDGAGILNRIANDDVVSVVSSSWAGGGLGSAENALEQMAAEGITYLQASGDYSAYLSASPQCKLVQGSYCPPQLSPDATVVGGTTLTTSGPGGSYVSEVAWSHSGGGWLQLFNNLIPAYQVIAVNSMNEASLVERNSPDVAAEADFDNSWYSNGQLSPFSYGGTSYATPRWAGLVAMANEQGANNCEPSVGFLNPILYGTLNQSSYTTSFHDVTNGSNGYPAEPQYDLATGLGSPVGPNMIDLLAPLHSSPTSTYVNSIGVSGEVPSTFTAQIYGTYANQFQDVAQGYVDFSLCEMDGSNCTDLCGGSVNRAGQISCTTEVNAEVGYEYQLMASYFGTAFSGRPNGCQASSASVTVLSYGYGLEEF